MNDIDRQFKYKTDAGGMKMLGVLMFILGPLTMMMAFQNGETDTVIWGVHISGPAVPWVIGFTAVLLVVVGVIMVRDGFRVRKGDRQIILAPTGIAVLGAPEISYGDISKISLGEFERRPLLSLTYPGGNALIAASRMTRESFDEVRNLLAERAIAPSP
jgi:hypothetical protein